MRICPTCDQQFDDDERTCPDDGSSLLVIHDLGKEQEDELIGMVIDGRYRVESKLGAGGMGAVFRGIQTAVGREVAIKVLAKSVATDVNAVKRFMLEAKAASALSHPNTITIHDFGQTEAGLLYLVMELVKGDTLAAILKKEGAMRPSRAVRIVGQMLHALQEAHGLRIIHRDLKPDNVLIAPRAGNPDFLKVLDFGLAKLTEGNDGATGLTQTGQVFGTPGYMSPEQARGEVCDLRADLYAVGVMLYEMLGGRRPFDGDNPLSVLVKHIQEPPPDFTTLDPPVQVAEPLRQVVFKTLAKAREDRYANAAEMHQALVEALDASGIEQAEFSGPTASPSVSQPNMSSPSLGGGPDSQLTLGSGIMGQVSLPAGTLTGLRVPGTSKTPLLLAGLAVVVLGSGFGAWQASLFGGQAQADPAAARSSHTAAVPAPTETKPAATKKAAVPVRVGVVSQPLGAAVKIEVYAPDDSSSERDVPKTPGSIEVLAGSSLRAEFSLKGYKGLTVRVRAAEGTVLEAKLEALPAAKPRVARKRPKKRPAKPRVAAPSPKPVAAPPPPKPKKPTRVPIDDLK